MFREDPFDLENRLVSGFPCVEWLERTIFSDATPSMCALS
jgi:hypothetical protein